MAYTQQQPNQPLQGKEEKTIGEDMPPVCQGCLKGDRFGKNCWVFWEKKKVCTMYENLSDPNRYYNGEPNAFWLL